MTITTNEPVTTPTEPDDLLATQAVDVEETDDETAPIDLVIRLAICVAFPTIAAAVMVGGIFTGASSRVYAGAGGLLGVLVAVIASRIRKPLLANLALLAGLSLIGLVLVIPSGVDNLFRLNELVGAARSSGDVLRPPVPLTPGWQAIIGWLMGLLGCTAAWVAIVLRKPAISLLLPLPVAGIAAISVPQSAQVASGIAVLALFAIGMGLLSGTQSFGDDEDRPSVGYEVRRAVRSLPLVAVITVALYFLSQANILFPKPQIDPTREPQKPKAVPLSAVEDRVLFQVDSKISGPWRIGSLDVYDGKDWRLPPFAENELEAVPKTGVVDDDLEPGVRATFEMFGLKGAVLPGLPNTVGILAEGPKLSYDARNGNIRTAEGEVGPGLRYTVVAAGLPAISELRKITGEVPEDIVQFVEIGAPPPAVRDLIAKAPKTSKWDEFDYLRTWILDNVTVTGAGAPKSVTAERVEDMISGNKEGTPFEIVAAQAMLARWIELPSRIGYGFDGGEKVGNILQVRPKHGATFVEVYFPDFKWLPVIGTPKNAKPTLGNEGQTQQNPNILPSNDISVQLFLPVVVPPGGVWVKQLRQILMVGVPALILLLIAYFTWPALHKSYIRGRRRRHAIEAGPRARIALAYAEFRDHATDFGYRHQTDTPLLFVDRFIPDDEHIEFAWLVTRALWGDLQHELTPELATVAEELSRTLRRRLAGAQPATLRAVAVISRLSLRYPYAPETDLSRRTKEIAHATYATT